MKLVEIFNSIQGEGHYAGTPMTFVRLGECNLNCSFCDTPQRGKWKETERDEVLSKILDLQRERVCITGGEPLLQFEEVLWLTKSLQHFGKTIHLETNGTTQTRILENVWIACSPKPNAELKLWPGQVNEWKILVGPDGPLTPIPRSGGYIYLQPLDPGLEPISGSAPGLMTIRSYLGRVHESVLQILKLQERNPEWRLSLQLHKLLNIQ